MKIAIYLKFCVVITIFLLNTNILQAQKHAVYSTDLDGDGIPDTGGQDKCPTTLYQIQGKKATAVNETTGKEVIVWMPEDLREYVFQDRTPLEEDRKVLSNKQAEFKREWKRVDEKYGKYADMKGSERKAKTAELDSAIALYQTKIDSVNEKIRTVDPNSYVLFTGAIIDKEGNELETGIQIKIRLNVDAFGCLKDDDRDNSPNMVDLCPNEIGTVEASGCPDRDRDNIPDREDDCPDVKGEKYARGCPDKDKDTVPDNKDDCPDTKGLVELKGCPDRDKDGIPDKDDACPDTKGLVELKGCPDKDKDGITDLEDKCPDEAGPKETEGCPDRDKDTVLDKDDKCPDVPGPVDNNGCPVILDKASKVLFEPGLAVIKSQSFGILDELVDLLKKYPDSYIALSGHTDGDGSEVDNLVLSKNRAKAVKDYLVKKGVNETHIFSTGYGEGKPIASNETTEGKTKNRRVEMKLSNNKEELLKEIE
jgi:outer membrane protein OmpA-like peptidoglycan-associated protein